MKKIIINNKIKKNNFMLEDIIKFITNFNGEINSIKSTLLSNGICFTIQNKWINRYYQ